jgi:hypothetical protein
MPGTYIGRRYAVARRNVRVQIPDEIVDVQQHAAYQRDTVNHRFESQQMSRMASFAA